MTTKVSVVLEVLPHGKGLEKPRYETLLSAGMDLRAALQEPLILGVNQRSAIPSGVRLSLPSGYEGQIRSRSGLSFHHGVIVLNAPGTIDADYKGELMIILMNLGSAPFEVTRGMRIAQLVISPVVQAAEIVVSETQRVTGKFGSTGLE